MENSQKTEKTLEQIEHLLIELAEGNLSTSIPINQDDSERVLAIKTGINMLVEELNVSHVSRDFLNSIYNNINDYLIVISETGVIKNINNSFLDSLQYTPKNVIGFHIKKILNPHDLPLVNEKIQFVLNGSKILDIGINFIHNNKTSSIPTSCSFSLIKEKGQKNILISAKDMTALLNAKELLKDKNEELNLFVYKASHDLKSPVSSMLGLMNLLRKTNNIEEIRSYNSYLERAIEKLDTILNELLIIGKIVHGELTLSSIDLESIIMNILDSIVYENINFEVKLNIAPSAKFILSEKSLIQSIFFNLIDNACNYRNLSENNPYLNIDIVKTDNGVCIVLKDNGMGINENDLNNVFKMFYRANTDREGTGLGLYIVKSSIQRLGGNIKLESTPNVGSTFTINLPCQI